MQPTHGREEKCTQTFHQRKLNIRESWWDPMAGFCKYTYKPSGTTEGEEFIIMHKDTISHQKYKTLFCLQYSCYIFQL